MARTKPAAQQGVRAAPSVKTAPIRDSNCPRNESLWRSITQYLPRASTRMATPADSHHEVRYIRQLRRIVALVSIHVLSFSILPIHVKAQSEEVLVSNWTQSVSATALVDDERLQTFTTGSHAAGYVVTSIELDFVLHNANDGLTVNLWTANGNRPGNRIAIFNTAKVAVGEPTEFAPGSSVLLKPDTQYFLHIAVKNPDDVVILKATKSYAEDRSSEMTSWKIGDSSIDIPDFGSTAWISEGSVIKVRIFGYERRNSPVESPQ